MKYSSSWFHLRAVDDLESVCETEKGRQLGRIEPDDVELL